MNSNDLQKQSHFLEKETLFALKILILLALILLVLTLVFGVARLVAPPAEVPQEELTTNETTADTEVSVNLDELLLRESADAGMTYIDRMIFGDEE